MKEIIFNHNVKIFYAILGALLLFWVAVGFWFPSYFLLAGAVILILLIVISQKIYWGFLFIVFFLPFERLGAYETAWGTIRLSQVFTIITLVAWFFQMLADKKVNFKRLPIFIPLILFLVVNLIGLLNAENLNRSVFVLLVTIFTMMVTVLAVNLVTDQIKLKKVLIILLVSSSLVSLFGLYQFIGDMLGLPYQITGLREHYTKIVLGFTRIQSTALEPLYFANYLIIPLSLVYAIFLSRFYQNKKWLLAILIFLLGINLFLTISRGGYLGILASLLLITILYFRQFFTIKKVTVLLVTILILYFVGVQFLQIGGNSLNWENFIEHVRGVFSGPSYVERINTFTLAYHAYLAHPLVGIGPGAFGPYAATFSNIKPEAGWPIVNNEFLELLTETGILGFSLFLIILLILFWRSVLAIKKTDDIFLKAMSIGLLGAFVGIIVQYQTFSILYIMHIWFLFGLMIACQNIILHTND